MDGYIIYNCSFYGDKVKRQTEELKEEFNKKGKNVEVVSSDSFFVGVNEDGNSFCTLEKADFIIYLDKDITVAEILQKSGYKLFNSPKAIGICDDKAKTYSALSGEGINLVKTYFAPKRYFGKDGERVLEYAAEKLGFPMIVKKKTGSLGGEVYKADNLSELEEISEKLQSEEHVFQEYITPSGRDIRVIVIGGKAVAAMERVNERDFRSNIELGGEGRKIELAESVKFLAEKCARVLGLDYCGVDILLKGAKPLCCEVNSNAFFLGIEKVTGICVSGLYADYVLNTVYGEKR